MKVIIDIPNSLYANLKTIKADTAAGQRILDCVKNGIDTKGPAKWIKAPSKGKFSETIECSLCHKSNSFDIYDDNNEIIEIKYYLSRFCPHCGALMENGDRGDR